jgi:hypothetical protein
MGEWVIKLLVIGFAGWVIWSLLQPRYVFLIGVGPGQARIRRGKVTPAFLAQITLLCQENGVAQGWIGGVQRGRRVALRFSRRFPPGLQQRLRNEWTLVG